MRLRIWLPVSLRRAYWEGVKDGRTWRWRVGWPPWEAKEPLPGESDTEPPPAVRAISHQTEGLLKNLAERWKEEDKRLLEACKTAEQEYLAADRRLGRLRQEDARAIREYEAAKSFYESLQHPLLPRWIYVLLFLLILIGEFFLNQLVFNIFLEPRMSTVLMAFSLVAAVVFAPEFMGRTLRRQRKGRGEVVGVVVLGVVVLIWVSLATSYIRQKYVEYAGVAALGLSLDPAKLVGIFWLFNILFTWVNAAAAYYASSPDPDAFGKAKRRLKEARTKMARLEPQLKELSERLDRARAKLAQAHVRRTREFKKYQHEAEALVSGGKTAVDFYWKGNQRARTRRKSEPQTGLPPCFGRNPCESLDLPQDLKQLDACGTCVYELWESQGVASAGITAAGAPAATMPAAGAPAPVPLVLSEVTNPNQAQQLFEAFVSATGLPNGVGSLGPSQLALCLDASAASLRTSKSEQDWQEAWERLVTAWEEVDSRVAQECPSGYVYHLFPHLALPLAFAMGAAVDLRRALVLCHQEQGRYSPVIDLREVRKLFHPPQGILADLEVKTQENPKAQKLIVHFFISDRHDFEFKNHPHYEIADNLAFVYQKALPTGEDWLPYLQHLWQGYKSYLHKSYLQGKSYQEIEVCLVCPAVVAFALGMAFSREGRVSVCQWFGGDSPPAYRPVFQLAAIEKRSKLPFS